MFADATSTRRKYSFKIDLQFVSLATVILLLFGWLAKTGVIPINTDLSLVPMSLQASRFFRLWMKSAMVLGVLVPTSLFLFFVLRSDVRRAFGSYLFVLVFQIATEVILVHVFFTSIAVPIGTLYTSFRLLQLWHSSKIIRSTDQLGVTGRKLVGSLLTVLFGFWLINLTFVLLVMEWPRLFAT